MTPSGTELAGVEQAVVVAYCGEPQGRTPAPLLKVATLPVALRAILSARRAGIHRFLVVLFGPDAERVREALLRHHRLPAGVDWVVRPGGSEALQETVRRLGRVEGRVLFLPGDAVFGPGLVERALGERGEAAISFRCNGVSTGISVFPGNVLSLLAESPPGLRTWEEIENSLEREGFLKREEVEDRFWQPFAGLSDLSAAERKLDRWLVKETDGIFSRFNRRISIPISRVLIRLPISPNMVTLMVLLVSAAAGVFLAQGGYFPMLFGALLSAWASILDGSDGEVARLTFRETAFGCWLETIGDYLYYVFLFAGTVIGLYRASHDADFLIWGGVFAAGAFLSFTTTTFQRRLYGGNEPDKFLARWQARMNTHEQNFFVRFARRHEFLIRRSFLPYYILALALVGRMDVVLYMCAVGSHIVWMATLISHRVVHRSPAAPA